jgi:taurine-pyruvate aminotransferase
MAPDWASADRRSTPARLDCGERGHLGKITAKAFASAVFHYPFSEAAMSLLNSPDPAVRAAVVQQDLGNVLHPIVQHKALETKQMVVTRSEGSTIVDADGTEYLDGMAGLWCVNIGYGRSELAEVAADQMRQLSYFPHTAMNAPAAALAEKINELMGGGYHTYFVNSGSEANERQ